MELSLEITANDLVERCRKGDTVGYRLLYNQYAKAMYNTALRIVNNTADAEDILQDSFIDAFHSLNEFQNRSSFGAWLKKIVIHKSINRVKRERRNWIDIELAGVDSQVSQDEPAIDEAEFMFRVESIKQGIQQLPDGYRTVLSLYLLEDYRHDEIADILGIAPATARTQYKRAKQKLLEIISKNNSL